jgi:hypothetical protein
LRNSTGDVLSQVADVACFLSALDLDKRRTRLDLLRQLHEKSSDESAITITLDMSSGSMQSSYSDSRFRARPSPDYLDMVRLPLDRLRLALRTGSTKTKQEEVKEREVWNRDMELLNSPRVKESERAVFEASDRTKDDPEGFLKVVGPHIEILVGLGERMEHVEQLQIGYWIDKQTVGLVRLKRWDEARRRLDAFFALPDRYRGRSSPSELDSMRKRLERCRKMTGR